MLKCLWLVAASRASWRLVYKCITLPLLPESKKTNREDGGNHLVKPFLSPPSDQKWSAENLRAFYFGAKLLHFSRLGKISITFYNEYWNLFHNSWCKSADKLSSLERFDVIARLSPLFSGWCWHEPKCKLIVCVCVLQTYHGLCQRVFRIITIMIRSSTCKDTRSMLSIRILFLW